MIKLVECTPVIGDCTCGYNVILDKEYTVHEFIETMLKERNNEWGFISNHLDSQQCEYRYGKILENTFTQEILHKKIIKVSASGGWTRMDYIVKTE